MVQGKGNHRFVSGAEEKVVRVFEAPLSFVKTLKHTCAGGEGSFPEDLQADVQVLGANMSALGLSQKPIYLHSSSEPVERNGGGEGLERFETVPEAAPAELKEPPIENQLAFHTLWPESHKLYGHGNELFSLCSNHNGSLVASSCKTMERFSQKLMAKVEAHKRIIWACSWNPFGHQFATSSRDKTVKIWSIEKDTTRIRQILALPQFGSSVTAVAWTGLDHKEKSARLCSGWDGDWPDRAVERKD